MKKIVFMGSDPIALPLLEYLNTQGADLFKLAGIVSQPDRPSGRGKKLQPNAISKWALDNKLPLKRPEKPDEDLKNWLTTENIDLVLVMAYGHIIKEDLLKTPPLPMLNFHGSLLPKYRGAAPIEASIANGDSETGITLMEMVKKMDAGGMLDKETVPIHPSDTSKSIRLKCADACVPLIHRNIKAILSGSFKFTPQDESQVIFTRKITKTDLFLDFSNPASTLVNRIRAIGGYFKHGENLLKIGQCEAISGNANLGQVLSADSDGLTIGTSDNLLRILELQRPGGKMLNIADFLRGYPIAPGTQLEGNPEGMAPLSFKK